MTHLSVRPVLTIILTPLGSGLGLEPLITVGAIISPSRTETESIISPAPKLSPKTLKNTEMTTTNPNTKP